MLAAAEIYGAIGREVRALGPAAWDHRVRTSALAKARYVSRAFLVAMRGAEEPAEWPRWTRAELLIAVRMAQPIPPPPMTPLPDEGVQ